MADGKIKREGKKRVKMRRNRGGNNAEGGVNHSISFNNNRDRKHQNKRQRNKNNSAASNSINSSVSIQRSYSKNNLTYDAAVDGRKNSAKNHKSNKNNL